jgi:tetratricopeptide (TPR) repeat protein
MASGQQSELETQINNLLSTANTFMEQHQPTEARDLYLNAKLLADERGLADYVRAANRCLAVSHLEEATIHFNNGDFDGAEEKYQEAEHAYREFQESFEEAVWSEHMGALIRNWANNRHGIGNQFHVSGNELLSGANENPDAILEALGTWDKAIVQYGQALSLIDDATKDGITTNPDLRSIFEQSITDIKSAAVGWANSINRPDIAKRYL